MIDYEDLSVRQRIRGVACSVHPDHKLALVGEAPGPRTRADCPFYPYPPSSAAGRFLTVLGWTRSEYLLTFARTNLLSEWPGTRFPASLARSCVPEVVRELSPRPLLLMGRGVASAFGLPDDHPILQLTDMTPRGLNAAVVIIPHPSGRNLWYNEMSNRVRVRMFVNALRDGRLTTAVPIIEQVAAPAIAR